MQALHRESHLLELNFSFLIQVVVNKFSIINQKKNERSRSNTFQNTNNEELVSFGALKMCVSYDMHGAIRLLLMCAVRVWSAM